MFEFKTKTKQLAIALTVVGAILWVVGFALNGSSSHDAGHGHDAHATEMHADAGHDTHAEEAHADHGHEAVVSATTTSRLASTSEPSCSSKRWRS